MNGDSDASDFSIHLLPEFFIDILGISKSSASFLKCRLDSADDSLVKSIKRKLHSIHRRLLSRSLILVSHIRPCRDFDARPLSVSKPAWLMVGLLVLSLGSIFTPKSIAREFPETLFVSGLGFPAQSVHDDRDFAITYVGSWGQNQDPKRYRGTQTFSNHPGDTANFTFTGPQISLIYARQSNGGTARVTIDGSSQTQQTLNFNNDVELGEQLATFSGLRSGTHTISVQVLGAANSQTGYVIIDGFITGPATGNIHDDRDSSVSYIGSWISNTDVSRLNGTQTFSNSAGNKVSFSFVGSSVSYIYSRQWNAGKASISIDGQIIDTVDEYNATEVGIQLATYSGFSDGAHTLVVTVLGTATVGSADKYVIIDGFIANPYSTVTSMHDQTDTQIGFNGAWASISDPSQYGGSKAYSNVTGSTATFQFRGSSVSYVYGIQNNCGIARIVIDNAVVDNIDQYSSVPFGQQVSTYTGLSNGAHTLTIYVVGSSNPLSSGNYVIVDAVIASAVSASDPAVAASTGQASSSQQPPTSATPSNVPSPSSGSSKTSRVWNSGSTSNGGTGWTPHNGSLRRYHHDLEDVAKSTGAFAPTGNCLTDDTAALQSLLDTQTAVILDRPIGGCYLISKTLILKPGNLLYGRSANNPISADQSHGVIIRLAANSNCSLIRTFDSYDPPGGGNEFMSIENIVFDGNGAGQSAEMHDQALVDFRGTFIETYLRHVVIINSFGPALFTGSTQLNNLWIVNTTTSSYAWIHNPGQSGLGSLQVDQVYVEQSILPSGGAFQDAYVGNAVNNPASYSHAILFNGMSSATINQLHCESAATCLDIRDIQTLTIHGITASRLGNFSSADPTDRYLIRALNTNIFALTFTSAYFDQSGSSYSGDTTSTRVFGLGNGVVSNDIYETPPGKCVWPSYTWGAYDQGQLGVPYLGERSIVTNELWIQQTGSYSPNRLAIWDNKGAPSGSYAYFERNGNQINLGFSDGPWDSTETHLMQMNYFGQNNPSNNVTIGSRLQTGSQSNTDLSGELTLSAVSSVTYTFSGTYSVHPECTVTPTFDIGQGNRLWVTYNDTGSFTLRFAAVVTGVASYVCVGRQ